MLKMTIGKIYENLNYSTDLKEENKITNVVSFE